MDRSIVRWAVIGFLFYGGAAVYALGALFPALNIPSFSATFAGLQLSLFLGCGLLVPLHPLKRGLHDLLTGSLVIRGAALPVELIARAHNPRRDRNLVIVAAMVAILTTGISWVVLRNLPTRVEAASRVTVAMKQMGIENPGVSVTFARTTTGPRHTIIASGFIPTNADGTPAVANAHAKILLLIRREIPLDGVDAIGTTLRSGINIGIYSSYEISSNVEPSRGAAP